MEVEHKLTDMAYGVGRFPAPQEDGSTGIIVLLKFAKHDGTESWTIPLSEKAASEIGDMLKGTTASKIVPASLSDLRKLG